MIVYAIKRFDNQRVVAKHISKHDAIPRKAAKLGFLTEEITLAQYAEIFREPFEHVTLINGTIEHIPFTDAELLEAGAFEVDG